VGVRVGCCVGERQGRGGGGRGGGGCFFWGGGGGQVTGSLMKMRTEEFHVLQIVPHFIRMRISFMSHVACMGELGKGYNILV
jgi:hypothetical protein